MTAIPRKILLIDDDRLQARLTAAQFRNFHAADYELDWAATYDNGLERLLSGDYSACLLDYQLGELDGLDLIREAEKRGCRTPIIFLTAETAERVDIEAMNAGALDYLVKGEITPRLLERSIRYALKLGDTLEELRRLATRDELTGLLNRREFDRILAEEAERVRRFGRSFALIMIDVDHFKQVNDTHGHPVGDGVLRQLAARLRAQLRSVDRLARFGGEEFAVVVMETDRAGAGEIARRLCAAIAQQPVAVDQALTLSVTISAGVAEMPRDAKSGAELVAAADHALYLAKGQGRNCAVALTG